MHSFCLGNFPWWMNSSLALSKEGQELVLLRKTCFSRVDAGVWGWEPWHWKPVSRKGKAKPVLISPKRVCCSLEVSELLVDAVWMTWSLSPGGPLKLTWPCTAEAVKGENTFNKGHHAYPRWKQTLSFSFASKSEQVTLHLGNVIQKSLWKNGIRKWNQNGIRKPGPKIWLCHSRNPRENKQCPCSPGWLLNQWNWQKLNHNFKLFSNSDILCLSVVESPGMFLNVHLLSLISPLHSSSCGSSLEDLV